MPVIYLVRHGQASFGAADYDNLSELGRRQSALLGPVLAGRCGRPDRVITGTLRRQIDTAAECLAATSGPATSGPDGSGPDGSGPAGDPRDAPAAEAPAIPGTPERDPRWNEYDFTDVVAQHRTEPHDPARQPAGATETTGVQSVLDGALARWVDAGAASGCAESFPAFTTRVRAALDELAAGLGSGSAAVVFTSGGPIAAVAAALLGLPPAGFVALNRVVANGGISKVVHGARGSSLLSFNEHAHFDGAGRTLLTYR